jgi:hypothetical protein
MNRRIALAITLWLVAAVPTVETCWAQDSDPVDAKQSARLDAEEFEGYIRVRYDRRRKPIALETSVTRFEGKTAQGERVTVDLIGVVHIGESDYYEAFNQLFPKYDAVLYELVAPEGTRIPKGGRIDEGLNPLAALQNGLKSILDLEFQLDLVDYTSENLVHADMSPEEFLASMKENDESFAGYFLRAIGQGIAQQNSGQINEADLLMSVFADDPAVELRRVMARQMKDIESGMLIFQGRNGSTIITHRNRKALDVLRNQIDEGRRHLAIFYGAGHLPDMQRQLMEDFGMVRGGRFWMPAWKLVR